MLYYFLKKRTISLLILAVILIVTTSTVSFGYGDETSQKSNQQKLNQSQSPAKPTENNQGKKTAAEAANPNAPAYDYTAPTFGENKLSYPMLILRTIAVLAVIILGVYILLRILVKNKRKIVTKSELIKILATFPLAANKIIQVVDIGGKIFVLGVTDSNINLITTIEDKETIDKIQLVASKHTASASSFKEQFLRLIGGKGFQKGGQISYLDTYKKRIHRMKKL